jgi:3-deoxy-D-manno-octulosonic-acid transferase
VQVRNPERWKMRSRGLLADENRRAELGRNALQVVRENLGAVDRTVEMILEKLEAARNLHRAEKINCRFPA